MSVLNLNTIRSEALFASALQPSEAPTPADVQRAIRLAVRNLGSRGCAALVAQEFGDHPERAVERMCWARELVAQSLAGREPAGGHYDMTNRTQRGNNGTPVRIGVRSGGCAVNTDRVPAAVASASKGANRKS